GPAEHRPPRTALTGLRRARRERAGAGAVRARPGGRVRPGRHRQDGARPGEHPRARPPDPGTSADPFAPGGGHQDHLSRPPPQKEPVMKKPRVLLADDHRVVAEGLRGLLDPYFDVVGIVSDGRELLAAAKQLDPDVVVLDISMPSLNGIEAARQLRSADSRAKVVFLTMHREVTYAARSLEAGASGFVLKHAAASELVTAIQEALKGGTYITPQVAGDLLDSFRRGIPAGDDALGELTPRQREVLQLVAE